MNFQNGSSDADIARLSQYLMQATTDCELCSAPGGEILLEDEFCRVIRVSEADYPGFCRVVLQQHVAEMTDMSAADQSRLMRVVFSVESAIRELYQPDKMNLASFGNVVPHVHWHIIPRWRDDRHFPQPVWGTPQRVGSPQRPNVSTHRLREAIAHRLVD